MGGGRSAHDCPQHPVPPSPIPSSCPIPGLLGARQMLHGFWSRDVSSSSLFMSGAIFLLGNHEETARMTGKGKINKLHNKTNCHGNQNNIKLQVNIETKGNLKKEDNTW